MGIYSRIIKMQTLLGRNVAALLHCTRISNRKSSTILAWNCRGSLGRQNRISPREFGPGAVEDNPGSQEKWTPTDPRIVVYHHLGAAALVNQQSVAVSNLAGFLQMVFCQVCGPWQPLTTL